VLVPLAGATSLSNKQKLYVSWAGAGIFFFWQLGMSAFFQAGAWYARLA
jgi:hypothetical protein